jgi:hypothetical protein
LITVARQIANMDNCAGSRIWHPSDVTTVSSAGLDLQKRALTEGLRYQTLIVSLLHKYASGRLKEV